MNREQGDTVGNLEILQILHVDSQLLRHRVNISVEVESLLLQVLDLESLKRKRRLLQQAEEAISR